MEKNKVILFTLALTLILSGYCRAQEAQTTDPAQTAAQDKDATADLKVANVAAVEKTIGDADDTNYTLGPNDVLEVKVQRHPEFSGRYPVNSEGKIQYDFVGDVDVNGITKDKVKSKIKELISTYVVKPEIDVKIAEYHSKAVYVIGEVARPGKYYIKSQTIPVREAIIEAGLPIQGAAMQKSRLITPNENSEGKTRVVDLYAILYNGNLKDNFQMHPGEQLYVPSASEEAAELQNKMYAQAQTQKSEETKVDASSVSSAQAVSAATQAVAGQAKTEKNNEEVIYTLGPDDIIEITVQRHPEFSGVFPINLEGKIQFKLVGDMEVTGLTKKELEAKIKKLIAGYVVNPEVNITILEYRSKVYYVIGEVGRPGKYYMRSETIPVREAVMEAGLPLTSAAMRKCRLISPDKSGSPKTKSVDLYSILYAGNLKRNIEMRTGDVLYVPATVMAKVFRVIAPVTAPVTDVAAAQTGVDTVVYRPTRPTTR